MSAIDPVRFPTLAAYLDALPGGVRAYPECRSKGALLRSALEDHDLSHVADGLPHELRQVFEAPPPVTDWVPAVHADAAFHAVCDTYYPTSAAMMTWTYDRTVAMASRPMYRALVRVAGPAVFLKVGSRVHGLFQRGTDLEGRIEKRGASIDLTHPPHLHSRLNHESNIALFRGIIEMTGGKKAECDLLESTATKARYACRWT